MTRTLKKRLWLAGLAFLAFGLGFYVFRNPALRSWEEAAMDFFFALRPSLTQSKIPETVLVLVDGKAVGKRYGYYDPLPRRYLAKLVDTLSMRGARIIALDIALFDKYEALDPRGDTLLFDAMSRAGNVAAVCAYETDEEDEIRIRYPHPFFLRALKGVGYANLEASSKGSFALVRAVKPWVQPRNGPPVPSFSTYIYCLDQNLDVQRFIDSQMSDLPPSRQNRIPLTNEAMMINFVGPPAVWQKSVDGSWTQQKEGRIVTYRSSAVTDGAIWKADAFDKKVVFVGSFSEFSLDQFITPYYGFPFDDEPMRGVEVHTNAFLTILQNRFIRPLTDGSVMLLLACVALLTVTMTSRFGLMGDLISVVSMLVAIWIGGYVCFAQYNLWIPAASVTLTVVFSYLSTTVYSGLTEKREKKRITNIFGQYVDERVVEQLIENPEMSKIGGVNREITILFSDLKGFTKLSEHLGAEKIVKLMNTYLTEMTDIIVRNEGTIDKFIGDSIMAFWGAPLLNPDAAYLACRSALQMQDRLEEIRDRWKEYGDVDVRQRIGINTGVCIIGNVGSQRKTNYTAIGDAVNLASRLEGVNKRYGTSILVSGYTHEKLVNRFSVREIEEVIVQGKSEPVSIYELRGLRIEGDHSIETEFLLRYGQAIKAYKNGEWVKAAGLFEMSLQLVPDDPVSKYFIEKITVVQTESPGTQALHAQFVPKGDA